MNKIKPTIKQKRYYNNLIANDGNKKKALLDAGYSQAIAKNPQKVETSKGFIELLSIYAPDDELLQENRKNWKQDTDKGAKNKAIDTALRLKNRFPKDETEFESGELTIKLTRKA